MNQQQLTLQKNKGDVISHEPGTKESRRTVLVSKDPRSEGVSFLDVCSGSTLLLCKFN